MIHRVTRPVLILCALLAARAALAGPRRLDDGTNAERWTLPNGLEIVTRDVPGASAVSVTWGFRVGLDHDPVERPGLASLLAEVAFTAPAGDVPERTRDEMESIRPQGWSLRVNRRQTLFTEAATTAQLPGVLHEVAARMRGVTVTDSCLRHALATVRRLLGEKYFGAPEQMLYWQVREYARGLDRGDVVALAAAKGIANETPASVGRALARAYVPANGVLALAGDLSTLDLHAFLASEFGALPAGERLPDPPPAALDSVTVLIERPEVAAPTGALGIIAPALTDTLSPSFYLAMLVLGTQAKQSWGSPSRPTATSFQYALLDDPGFVRLYPRLAGPGATNPQSLSAALDALVDDLLGAIVQRDVYDSFRYSMLWMMGGAMSRTLAENVRRDPAALNALSLSLASQALWGDEAFWSEYRRRFDFTVSPGISAWGHWLRDPRHQVRLLLTPKR